MAELQEHGYPDWQRLSQQQVAPLYKNAALKVGHGETVSLGKFYVALYPALSVLVEQIEGEQFLLVEFVWHSEATEEATFLQDRFELPENEGLLRQQLICSGQWVEVKLIGAPGIGTNSYRVILQPNALVYAEPRLGDGVLAQQNWSLGAGKSTIITIKRVAPGPVTVCFRINAAGVSTNLLFERFTGGVWVQSYAWVLSVTGEEFKAGGRFAQPLNLPRGPVRFKIVNGGAAEQSGEFYLTYP